MATATTTAPLPSLSNEGPLTESSVSEEKFQRSSSISTEQSKMHQIPTNEEERRKYFMNRLRRMSKDHMAEKFSASVNDGSSSSTSMDSSVSGSVDARRKLIRAIDAEDCDQDCLNMSSLDMSLRGLNFVEENADDMTSILPSSSKEDRNVGLPSLFTSFIQSMTTCGAMSQLRHEDEAERARPSGSAAQKRRSFKRSGQVEVLNSHGRTERVSYEKGSVLSRDISYTRSRGSVSSYSRSLIASTIQTSDTSVQNHSKEREQPIDIISSTKSQDQSSQQTPSEDKKPPVVSKTNTAVGTITATAIAVKTSKTATPSVTKGLSPRSSPLTISGRPPLCPSPSPHRQGKGSSRNTPPRRPVSPNSPSSPPVSTYGGDHATTPHLSPPPPPPPSPPPRTRITSPRTPPKRVYRVSSSSYHLTSKDAPVTVTPPSPLRRQNAKQKEDIGGGKSPRGPSELNHQLNLSLWNENDSSQKKINQKWIITIIKV